MTLLMAYANRRGVAVASDRLLTLQRGKNFTGEEHTPHANKSIIYVCKDGFACFAFSGTAYVGEIPTDTWIASKLWWLCPSSDRIFDPSCMAMHGVSGKIPKLASAIYSLVSDIQTTTDLVGVPGKPREFDLLVAGWKNVDRRVQPFIMSWNSRVGYQGSLNTFIFENASFSGDLSTRPQAAFRNFIQEARRGDILIPASLAKTIDFTGNKSKYVGRDAMVVTMPRPGEKIDITTEFFPSQDWILPQSMMPGMEFEDASVTPWLVTPGGYTPPLIISGQISTSDGNVKISHIHHGKLKAQGGRFIAGFSVQDRKKRPR